MLKDSTAQFKPIAFCLYKKHSSSIEPKQKSGNDYDK